MGLLRTYHASRQIRGRCVVEPFLARAYALFSQPHTRALHSSARDRPPVTGTCFHARKGSRSRYGRRRPGYARAS